MTTAKRHLATAEPYTSTPLVRFPDHQPSEETVTIFYFLLYPALPAALARYLGNPETTIVASEFAAALFATASRRGLRYPDLLIAFDVDPAAFEARNGYLIPEQGKPPDFILEIASASTGSEDEGAKRADYEAMGVREYWRFDNTGGDFHSVPLAGDRLVNGRYMPIEIVQVSDEIYRGHSDALNLDLCWEYGDLRWYDPASGSYLRTYDEADDERIDAERRASDERRERIDAERRASDAQARASDERRERIDAEARAGDAERRASDAEARAARLEAELRRLQSE